MPTARPALWAPSPSRSRRTPGADHTSCERERWSPSGWRCPHRPPIDLPGHIHGDLGGHVHRLPSHIPRRVLLNLVVEGLAGLELPTEQGLGLDGPAARAAVATARANKDRDHRALQNIVVLLGKSGKTPHWHPDCGTSPQKRVVAVQPPAHAGESSRAIRLQSYLAPTEMSKARQVAQNFLGKAWPEGSRSVGLSFFLGTALTPTAGPASSAASEGSVARRQPRPFDFDFDLVL